MKKSIVDYYINKRFAKYKRERVGGQHMPASSLKESPLKSRERRVNEILFKRAVVPETLVEETQLSPGGGVEVPETPFEDMPLELVGRVEEDVETPFEETPLPPGGQSQEIVETPFEETPLPPGVGGVGVPDTPMEESHLPETPFEESPLPPGGGGQEILETRMEKSHIPETPLEELSETPFF